jgi:hypothetical protein
MWWRGDSYARSDPLRNFTYIPTWEHKRCWRISERSVMSTAPDSELSAKWVGRACDAIAKGCCLELYYDNDSVVVEAHTVGYDETDRPAVLAWERLNSSDGPPGEWRLSPLDEVRKVAVSGYFSNAPRAGFNRDDKRFRKVCCQV